MTYACGYILTTGWNFRDATGPLQTFCPVTLDELDIIIPLVFQLKVSEIPSKDRPRRVRSALHPLMASMSRSAFESLCICTLMRINFPLPTGAADDWLTMPSWALRISKRRMRLTE
jgi:hypothetical protein